MNQLDINRPQSKPLNNTGKIEMPPLDQIQAVAAALDKDRVPMTEDQPQYERSPQIAAGQEEFPIEDLNNLPMYDSNYNPQQVEVPEEQQYQQSHAIEKQQEESVQARNFREMREHIAKRDREIEQLRQQFNQQLQQQAANKHIEIEDQELSFDPDDLANGGHLNKMAKELKDLRKELKQTKLQSEDAKKQAYKADVEQHLRRLYPDFDSVVTNENIEKFAQNYAPLARSIAADSDYFNQCNAAYMAIKNTGIAQTATIQPQIDRIKQNAAKPRPLVSIAPQQSESPLARANAFQEGLTPELAKNLLKEMNSARQRI